jgi:hypothetical protein
MMSMINTTSTGSDSRTRSPAQERSWRDVLPIHPAADLFPLMGADELDTLAADVKQHGQRNPVTLWVDDATHVLQVLDGRNRLDAMERAGIRLVASDGKFDLAPVRTTILFSREIDPFTYVISANIHRRHLDAEQRRALIAKLLKATPDTSDRQLAEQVKTSPTTVGKVRKALEDAGDVSKLDSRTDARGRKQPAQRKPAANPLILAAADRAERRGEENRRHQAAAAVGVSANSVKTPPQPPAVSFFYGALIDAWSSATPDDRQRFLKHIGAAFIDVANGKSPTPPADDLGIPPFLLRDAPEAAS